MPEFADISVPDIAAGTGTDFPPPEPSKPAGDPPPAEAEEFIEPDLSGEGGEIFTKFKDVPWEENESLADSHAAAAEEKDLRAAKRGPRFEGWYTRITDSDGARTFAFVAGSFLPPGVPYSPDKPLPGYLAVLVSDGAGGTLKVYEAFPDKTRLTVNGKPVFNANPQEFCPGEESACRRSEFTWSAEGYGHVNNNEFSLAIPGEAELKGTFGAPVYWNNDITASPEGMVSNLPMVPIHWYVHSLGSPSVYEYTLPGEGVSVRSTGYAHIEKNWGKGFPSKWIWSEGITDGNGSHYALAGGVVKLGPLKPKAFLAGFHTSKVNWDFKPQQGTKIKTRINACEGTFSMLIARPGKFLLIESSAAPQTFGKVSIPTASGFVRDGGAESFAGTTNIKAYTLNIFGRRKLVDDKTFTNAALEFGANYMCGGF